MARSKTTQDSKKPRNAPDQIRGPDLISDLPELILSRILSLMPTRDAVRTSVLSRDWEYKWRCITNVDINDYQSCSPREKRTKCNFVNFVGRVVLQTNNITSFRLSMSVVQHNTKRFAELIGAVSMRGVQSLVLRLQLHGVLVLPRSLLQNTSLRSLVLQFSCTLKVPACASFPNLERLILYDVDIKNHSSNDTLTLYLPVLKIFELDECSVSGANMMEVHAPVLTTFRRTFTDDILPDTIPRYSIKIFSERLVKFTLVGVVNEAYVFIGQQVLCAVLSYANDQELQEDDEIRTHSQTLLSGFSNLRELIISGQITKVIWRTTPQVPLPVFHHLVRLVVENRDDEDNDYANGLLVLLHATPSLKFLSIVSRRRLYYDDTAVTHVPVCVKDHLEEIEINLLYSKRTFRLHLLQFLLENGRAIKRVHIRRNCKITKEEITKYILALPISSTTLTVVVE